MLHFYKLCSKLCKPLLNLMLERRTRKGKEWIDRIPERKGIASKKRPEAPLIWLHGASIGEAQSALILINRLLADNPKLHILVTTGTVTSAQLMSKNLPERAFHQFYPLDHPKWVERFLEHWSPDMALWMESEIWPNMLQAIKSRSIPAALINARLSDTSFKRWSFLKKTAHTLISTFSIILTQTQRDAQRFKALGAQNVTTTDNLKYSAAPLPYESSELKKLSKEISNRPCWLFASTHKGEEEMAAHIHEHLKKSLPNVLTLIVPRHPDRRDDIRKACTKNDALKIHLRGPHHQGIPEDTDIYVADTLGELGLFYRLTPLACIGRSFSDDGGGGHNPIEAAQLNCAVLHGPHVQYQRDIFQEMDEAQAAIALNDEQALRDTITELLSNSEKLKIAQDHAMAFAKNKEAVIERVLHALEPILTQLNLSGTNTSKSILRSKAS